MVHKTARLFSRTHKFRKKSTSLLTPSDKDQDVGSAGDQFEEPPEKHSKQRQGHRMTGYTAFSERKERKVGLVNRGRFSFAHANVTLEGHCPHNSRALPVKTK